MSTGGLGLCIEYIGLWEVRGVEALEASEPDFTGVTLPQASPSSIRDRDAEFGTGGRGGESGTKGSGTSSVSSASIGFFAFSLHLEAVATLATIILQASYR
jgi:hypothetical protein